MNSAVIQIIIIILFNNMSLIMQKIIIFLTITIVKTLIKKEKKILSPLNIPIILTQ